MADIKEILKDRGILGLLLVPVCWIIGHDFHVGRACIRCYEPRKR